MLRVNTLTSNTSNQKLTKETVQFVKLILFSHADFITFDNVEQLIAWKHNEDRKNEEVEFQEEVNWYC